MQKEYFEAGTLRQTGLMFQLDPRRQFPTERMGVRVAFVTPVAAEPAPAVQAAEPSTAVQESMPEEVQSSGGEEQELGEEEQNPATPIDPIDMNEIDKLAKALLYIQSIAFGTQKENESLEQWPVEVLHLHGHCRRHADGLRDFCAKVDEIVQYSPGGWINCPSSFQKLKSTIITPMWKAALSSAFISRDLCVMIKWMHSFNHYAVQANLLCKFVIQGVKKEAPKLMYQAQGRLAKTRYSKVNVGKRLRQDELEAACTGSRSKHSRSPAAAAVAASAASTATAATARSTGRT
jgi:hypothetical protein